MHLLPSFFWAGALLGMDAEDKHMSRPSWFSKLYWSHFGKPSEDRALVKHLLQTPVSSIVEFGVGDCQRIRRIAKMVQAADGVEQIRYVGTDEFEAANEPSGHISLKQAHQIAGSLGFKVTLMPGDVASAAPRVAHKVGASDLIIVNGGMDASQPANGPLAAWLDHLCHEQTSLFASREVGGQLVQINLRQFADSAARAA
ncbi:MAG: hypothetical protein AAGG44_00240 [Planctomycetota bacterium]